jgi:rRNA small subunit pseudouridine methyltransferase Nep1
VVLRILLADAALELIPNDIAGHPSIRKIAQAMGKRPGTLVLDQNHHKAAIGQLEDHGRRGRPDILHYCLLSLLESPLAKREQLEVAIHTRDGELIKFRPDTRLPRGETRFHGVMSRVLREGQSHDKDPLIVSEGLMNPQQALQKFAKGTIIRLDENGTLQTPLQLADTDQEITLIIGAYPRGEWTDDWQKAAPNTASLWPEALNAWTICSEAVTGYRARWGPRQ